MSWATNMLASLLDEWSDETDSPSMVRFAIRLTIEECANRACDSEDRADILAMLEDK